MILQGVFNDFSTSSIFRLWDLLLNKKVLKGNLLASLLKSSWYLFTRFTVNRSSSFLIDIFNASSCFTQQHEQLWHPQSHNNIQASLTSSEMTDSLYQTVL